MTCTAADFAAREFPLSPPLALYRLQLHAGFGFDAARSALPYLHALGISHLYLSPVFRSRPGSTHGYDVTDHSRLNPELGGETAFRALAAACRSHGMGLVLDIVPNHMAVMTADNAWWMDVLRHGPASRYAAHFDIDWSPPRASMRNRLLVPVLGEPLGDVIAQRGIALTCEPAGHSFAVRYGSQDFPLDPRTRPLVLGALARAAGDPSLRESDDPARIAAALESFNAQCDGAAADDLAALLAAQPFRLAFWRVSGEEINYRRFFDVNELAALRMENPQVFEATHALVCRLWREGCIDGLRIDHADGLYDPQQYFLQLRRLLGDGMGRRPWIVAEKILGPDEKLREEWAVEGTTGYEFAALVAGWLMDGDGVPGLESTYRRFTGPGPPYADIAYYSRRHVMRTSLAAEISGLAVRLDRLAQLHHNTLDFTLFDLREAIVEVIANFPVYRTYVREDPAGAEDAQIIHRAVGAARSRNASARRALRFLEQVLLGEVAQDPKRRTAALDFVQKFQQVTPPVMAKGLEDTACYRHACLLAMNEVGADPTCRGIGTEVLHRANEARLRAYPASLLATSTHDTKRGEDARYRLCALSQVPELWAACVGRWRRLKTRQRDTASIGSVQAYLLLQSLLSIWPMDGADRNLQALRERLEEYAVKAAREAKELTSWLEPDEEYEERLRQFVRLLLPEKAKTGFPRYFAPLLEPVAFLGALNALSSTALKLTSPGVPDIYQGNELPQLVLVDPDNRRTPDLQAHQARLEAITRDVEQLSLEDVARALRDAWRDGGLKLFLTWRLLQLRAGNPRLFAEGRYLALPVEGGRAAHLCAFARVAAGAAAVTVVSRWPSRLVARGQCAFPDAAAWGDTRIGLPADMPAGNYMDVLTGRAITVGDAGGGERSLAATLLFPVLPVSVLLAGGSFPAVRTAAANGP